MQSAPTVTYRSARGSTECSKQRAGTP